MALGRGRHSHQSELGVEATDTYDFYVLGTFDYMGLPTVLV